DGAEPGQLGSQVLADLDGPVDHDVAEPGGVVDQEFGPWFPAEQAVLDPVSGGGHVEARTVPVEPVRGRVRAPIGPGTGDDGVSRLGQECVDLVFRRHAAKLTDRWTTAARGTTWRRPGGCPATCTSTSCSGSRPSWSRCRSGSGPREPGSWSSSRGGTRPARAARSSGSPSTSTPGSSVSSR